MTDHTPQESLVASGDANTIENLLDEMVDLDADFSESDKDPLINLDDEKIQSFLALELGNDYMAEFVKLLSFVSKGTFLHADTVSDLENHATDADEFIIGQVDDDPDGIIRVAAPDGDTFKLINQDELLERIVSGDDKIETWYDAANEELIITTNALDAEEVQDEVDTLVSSGSNLSWSYDDENNDLEITAPSIGDMSQVNADDLATQVSTNTSNLEDIDIEESGNEALGIPKYAEGELSESQMSALAQAAGDDRAALVMIDGTIGHLTE